MPKRRMGIQSWTTFPANSLGGPGRLTGSIILADLQQVQAQKLWEKTFSNVGLIVNCIRQDFTVGYRKNATAKSQLVYVDARNKELRHPEFMQALPRVRECLEQGKDVLIHCRESFHRAPIVTACFIYMLTDIAYQVVHLSSTMEVSLH